MAVPPRLFFLHRRDEEPYDAVNWTLLQIIYGGFCGLLAIWWIASLYLYIRRRNHPCIAQSAVFLTSVGAVAGFLGCTEFVLYVLFKRWPCAMNVWAANIGMSTTLHSILLRGLLVFRKYNLCKAKCYFIHKIFRVPPDDEDDDTSQPASSISATSAKSTSNLIPPGKENKSKNRKKTSRANTHLKAISHQKHLASDRLFNKLLIFWVVLFTLWTLLSQSLTTKNRLWPSSKITWSDANTMRCTLSWEYAPSVILVTYYLLIGCPVGWYKLRSVNDLYGIRSSVFTGLVVGVPCFVAYFVWIAYVERRWRGVVLAFPDEMWGVVFAAANHATAVFWPVVRSFRKREGEGLEMSVECFERVLSDTALWEEFKKVAIADFNVDNALFWEEYTSLQSLLYTYYAKRQTSSSPTSSIGQESLPPSPSPPPPSPSPITIELAPIQHNIAPWAEEPSYITHNLPTAPPPLSTTAPKTTGLTPLPTALSGPYKTFYRTFIAPNAPLEVNLPSNITGPIHAAFTTRRRDDGEEGRILSVDIFDEAAKEVKWCLFGNTFGKFLECKKGNHHS